MARFKGVPVGHLGVFRCGKGACAAIPFQVDERDPWGKWALDRGAAPTTDTPPGVVDANDTLLFMAADAGARVAAPALPGARRVVEIELADPLGAPSRWAYAAAYDGQAPRSPARYVSYDPARDRIAGRTVQLGFAGSVPDYLALGAKNVNLLDRLKVRARASFLWGLIRIGRSEADLIGGPITWRGGPIRIIRRQRHAVRIGFGIRSPRFGSDTYFYRDFAELPVSISLRIPPRFIFTSISVRAGLDFRDLSGGWRLLAPDLPSPAPIHCQRGGAATDADGLPAEWFALQGKDATLVQRLQRGPTLRSVRQRLSYRSDRQPDPPEAVPGQCPGVGFVLDDWGRVGAGRHILTSASYALPAAADIAAFLAAANAPLRIRLRTVR